jgi:hypothetical protein
MLRARLCLKLFKINARSFRIHKRPNIKNGLKNKHQLEKRRKRNEK